MNKANGINELDDIKTDNESYPQVESQELSIDSESKAVDISSSQGTSLNNRQELSTAKRGRGRPASKKPAKESKSTSAVKKAQPARSGSK